MTTTTRTLRAPRVLFPLAIAGALSAVAVAPTTSFADTTSGAATATWAGAGVGYDQVIDGRSAGTNKLTVEGKDAIEAFCIEYAADIAKTGTYTAKTYTASGVTNVAKAADIAVRHASMGTKLAEPKAENTAAQLAIWKLTDAKDFSKVPNAAIVARANALYGAAAAHVEAASSMSVTATASVAGEADKAVDTVVALVKTDAGAPLAGKKVNFVVGAQTLTATTGADGKATVKLDAPAAATPMKLSVEGTLAAGTVLAPADGKQMMVTTADATVTRLGSVVLPKEPAKTVVEEKPTPVPTPTETAKPTPKPAPKPTTKPVPKELPHTGGWATTGMFAAAIGLAGAGFAGRRLFRRS